ncbi:signal recognition particle-docking protein FtsY [Oscillospiraceae bacterium LTW-04]|nr:signal recognition particle-docking protein FtsY [Oscillospiraceae bacterium MB24-C1]
MGLFSNISAGLRKISFTARIDDEYFEELEEQLIMADVGVQTSELIVSKLRERAKKERLTEASALRPVIKEVVRGILDVNCPDNITESPRVLLMIGVNGVGKTTSIGKLAARYTAEGKKVLLAAADTFRAAAIEQLTIWGERTGTPVVAHTQGSDPAAVVHDALQAGSARGADVIICDTAGRLHNKQNLMDELSKIRRVVAKELPDCVPEVLLVVDATTGQNALSQARRFKEAAGVNGIILTKLDGTAKGGVVIAIANEVSVPVRFVGVGEGVNDLYPFDATEFAEAIFGDADE